MSAKILVAFATRYGSTQEVAEVVADKLREHGLEVTWSGRVTCAGSTGTTASSWARRS